MILAKDFINFLKSNGYTFFSGVPCSFLKPLINYVIQSDDVDYVTASSEGEAVGIAAGTYLAGRKAVVMCQNSGLGNMVNPLTSLNFPFKIPTMIIVTQRGEPGINDEPQHELMGQITSELLDTLKIPWDFFPKNKDEIDHAVKKADRMMKEKGLPYALIMKKGSVEKYPFTLKPYQDRLDGNGEIFGEFSCKPGGCMPRMEAIKTIKECLSDEDAIVATTGKIGRELYTIEDKKNQIYIVGSMGCASGIGFGIQVVLNNTRVVVLDGDGAALMKMGTFATIGHYNPGKFTHVILDNEAYDSTGGQETISSSTDFSSIAIACGYQKCWRVEDEKLLKEAVLESAGIKGPVLIHVKVATGSDPDLGRPKLTPVEVKNRFMKFLAAN